MSTSASTTTSPPAETTPAPLRIEVLIGSPHALQPTSTLVMGKNSAVLVDAQFTRSDALRVVKRIKDSGLRLGTVLITHAHPDHYFGLDVIVEAFPRAYIAAAPEVVEQIERTYATRHAQWKPVYGADLTEAPILPEAFSDSVLSLEGHILRIMHIGQADVANSTMIHIPTQSVMIAGDLVTNGTHPWLAESTPASRAQWIRNLQALRDLGPKTVIAGHKKLNNPPDNGAIVIDAMLAYLRDFEAAVEAAVEASTSPDDIVKAMKRKHGDRELPGVLELSAQVAFAMPRKPPEPEPPAEPAVPRKRGRPRKDSLPALNE